MKNGIIQIILLSLLFNLCSCKEKSAKNFTNEWRTFETQLIRQTKSFQNYEPFENLKGDIKMVTYTSDSLELKGLLNTRNIDPLFKKPVVVYLHGGFALGYKQMEVLKPFTDAGYITFAPTYRGENGNPGNFELFMGEVKDAKTAIRWIAKQSYTDPERIYVFGWSVGGGISLNLSFHDDIPVKVSGSSAGIYDYDLIESWATEDEMIVFPYDHENELENYFRLPIYSLENMVRPHYTYIGEEDDYQYYKEIIDSLYPKYPRRFKLIKLKGNHTTSLKTAMHSFIKVIEN